MRLAEACPLVTVLALAFQSPAHAEPDRGPRARAADATPGGQRGSPAPVRVVLVRPVDADPITAEALLRIQGELAAEGFSVVLVDAPAAAPQRPPQEPREHVGEEGGTSGQSPQPGAAGVAGAAPPPPGPGVPSAGPAPPGSPSTSPAGPVVPSDRPAAPGAPIDAEAASTSAVSIRLSFDTSSHVAELVVVDRLRNKKLTRWIDTSDAPPDRLAVVLAVRAVELVRASLVELALPAARPPVVTAPEPAWALEAGTSVLVSPGGVGPAALAMARLRFAPLQWLELRLAFAGLGTSPRVQGPDLASARVTQLFALTEVALRPWPHLRARPSFSLGAGALHVSVEGEAPSPYRGTESSRWSALLGGGAGVDVLVGPRLGIAVETLAFAALPYPTVSFLGEQTARVGVPGLFASVTLVGWL